MDDDFDESDVDFLAAVDRVKAEANVENERLKKLFRRYVGDGDPDEALAKREQGAKDLADLIVSVGADARYNLSGDCQLPVGAVESDIPRSRWVDESGLTIVKPSFIAPGGRRTRTIIKWAGVPNPVMEPINDEARAIVDAWGRSGAWPAKRRTLPVWEDAPPAIEPLDAAVRAAETAPAMDVPSPRRPLLYRWRCYITELRHASRLRRLYRHPSMDEYRPRLPVHTRIMMGLARWL